MAVVYSLIIFTFITSLILTPITIKVAKKYEIVDIPKDKRKIHKEAMPRIGGLAIVLSMFIGLFIYYLLARSQSSIALNQKFIGYLIGALIIFVMGFIDDIFNLRARYKFIFQVVAASIIYFYGIAIVDIKIPFIYSTPIDLSFLSYPLTLLWIIGITNAINLIDGLDGLAAGISSISSVALLTIFVTTSMGSDAMVAIIITAALSGATLGFIPFNFNPAKTFMGDVGSNFLGFTLSVVSIIGFAKGYTIIAIIVPIIILGVPIFDSLFAIARRFVNKKPLFHPDGGHVHHRLLKNGYSQKQSVLILYTITSILCIIGVTIITADIYKLILLITATIFFIVLGLLNKEDK